MIFRKLCVALLITVLLVSVSRAGTFNEKELVDQLRDYEKKDYYSLQYLMNRYQKRAYLTLDDPLERKRWVDDFWTYLDPTPSTERNERRIEHEKRVKVARDLFGKDSAPGWDDRGETLIRYGMPSVRTKTPGNIGFYKMVPPGEMWYYQSLDMLIYFQDFNLNGIHIFAIEREGQTSRQTLDQLKMMNQFYTQSNIQELMFTTFNDIESLIDFNPDNIDYSASPDQRMNRAKSFYDAIQEAKMETSKRNFYKYLAENPTIYSFEVNRNPLPVYFDITNFKGGGDKVQSEVGFEIPSEEIRFMKKDGKLQGEVNIGVMVRDLDMNVVTSGGDLIKLAQEEGDYFQGPRYIPGQIELLLSPGYYRVGIEAIDINSKRRGVYNTSIHIEPMENRLAMSDIKFAADIKEEGKGTKFMRNGLKIIPHPTRAYRIPYPVTFYFEIYGLDTDSGGRTYYSVDYQITPVGKRREGPVLKETSTAVSSEFRSEGIGPTQTQRLQIATDNLWEGRFRITVRVRDRRSLRSVEKSSKFSILE
ncbi:MAG: GWxTD domain-containing protein [Candidatus Latescibacteria bacterium]|nr:GWxTD domain-containing protein [bacterium]MBD3424555.1 GWxTD domain-containing protein [Candidatus Latescibacterota bacterium]